VILIPLEFVGDAICLSGLTGTKLKCDVIRDYYSFWWGITSGGASRDYSFNTAIVEMNAATGEVFIEDTSETVLGSSGHSMELKIGKHPDTRNLKIVLIEEDQGCYAHLKNVVSRRWPSVSISEAEGPPDTNTSNFFLIKKKLDEALETISLIPNLGNSLYFFDPLRSVSFSIIEQVAGSRIRSFLRKGTEFFVFVFTSDWFLGRKDFAPLPKTIEENKWSPQEKETVNQGDDFYGNNKWRTNLLNNSPIEVREEILIKLYQLRLQKWFRYVLPLPFKPKENQIFHIMLCSNYEAGVRATRDFYCSETGNLKYSPNNDAAVKRFKTLHPDLFSGLRGRERPLQWKMLWKIIRDHEDGMCDAFCSDFTVMEGANWKIQDMLDWLEKVGYIQRFVVENPWSQAHVRYKLNWKVVTEKLQIHPPLPLVPPSPKGV
jgi:three-Cys-motif partner protein